MKKYKKKLKEYKTKGKKPSKLAHIRAKIAQIVISDSDTDSSSDSSSSESTDIDIKVNKDKDKEKDNDDSHGSHDDDSSDMYNNNNKRNMSNNYDNNGNNMEANNNANNSNSENNNKEKHNNNENKYNSDEKENEMEQNHFHLSDVEMTPLVEDTPPTSASESMEFPVASCDNAMSPVSHKQQPKPKQQTSRSRSRSQQDLYNANRRLKRLQSTMETQVNQTVEENVTKMRENHNKELRKIKRSDEQAKEDQWERINDGNSYKSSQRQRDKDYNRPDVHDDKGRWQKGRRVCFFFLL